ncbi:hypothetical protein AAL_02250 [Moelleriella libera RCEF 2490]|uniref:Protein kinase-like domain protein n=1 Tax=Moelleriella libera RCEF 2490 TaxID=1081109 RepID=A0A168FB81_9HYPO|nr:hypothetical protein AAL_02250 [Moelleriella libera RCEF 2490]
MALLGPIPDDAIEGSHSRLFFREKVFRHPDLMPEGVSLENSITKIHGEEKKHFFAFVRRMMQWDPRNRSTAKELLSDIWLCKDFSGGN